MLNRLKEGLKELVFPKVCVVCKDSLKRHSAIDDALCIFCLAKIKRNTPPFCFCCGRHLDRLSLNKNICPGCIKKTLQFDRAFSPCAYEGVIKDLIHAFKYNGKDYLGKTLSRLIIDFIKDYSLPMDYLDFIVPVPLHSTRLREREFNQAQVLGEYVAKEFNKPLLGETLKRIRNTRTQTELKEAERFLNVRDSFILSEDELIHGKNILLIDDVMTTAATCSEAASCLKKGGANIVFVLTLAN
jgi:competence protein ComFC